MQPNKWNEFNHKDPSTFPPCEGLYAFMIHGDSEYIDGYRMYEFDDYQTFGRYVGQDDSEPKINFDHDEIAEFAYAWFGPIVIPPYAETPKASEKE